MHKRIFSEVPEQKETIEDEQLNMLGKETPISTIEGNNSNIEFDNSQYKLESQTFNPSVMKKSHRVMQRDDHDVYTIETKEKEHTESQQDYQKTMASSNARMLTAASASGV